MSIDNLKVKSFMLTFLFFISLTFIYALILEKKLKLGLNIYVIFGNFCFSIVFYYFYMSLKVGKIKKKYTFKNAWSDLYDNK